MYLKFSLCIIIAFFSLLITKVNAQQGLHIQQYSYPSFQVFRPDSIYMTVDAPGSPGNGTIKRMALINPVTKDWKYVNPVDYSNYIGPFVMKNKMEGVMIYSSSQKVFKTTNGWQTMTEAPSVAGGYGLSQIVNTSAGYVGYEGTLRKIYFSADGISWTLKQDMGSGTPILRSFGSRVILYNGTTITAISNDGGQNFAIVDFNYSFIGGNLKSFTMLSKDTLLIATETKMHISLNGGINWSTKSFPTAISTITIKNLSEFYIVTGTASHYTNNSGDTWQARSTSSAKAGSFYLADTLYSWPAYKSVDNGLTWEPMFSGRTTDPIYDVSFTGNTGMIAKGLSIVDFSYDRGRTISRRDTVTGSGDIMAVKILSNGDLLAGDRTGQVFYSSNNGNDWLKKNSNGTNLNAVKFSTSADENIIVMTRLGQPVVSNDHGSTFAILNVGGGSHAQTVKPNGEIIDVGGGDFDYAVTFVYRAWEISRYTAAGAKTVLESFPMSKESLAEIHMADNNIGYLVTWRDDTKVNKIYKTINGWAGGSTLVSSIEPVNPSLANYQGTTEIQTFGADTVILSYSGNKYYHISTNGGVSWTQMDLPIYPVYATAYPSIKRTHFFDSDEYIMALNSTGIYLNSKGAGPGVITAVTDPGNDPGISAPGLARWVYPNPAKGRLSLSRAANGIGSLAIMDYTGKIILEKNDFNFSDELDISSLPGGMYIIAVRNGSEAPVSYKFIKE